MIGPDRTDTVMFRRIARRVEDILEAAREREENGQVLAVEIDARFRFEDAGALQFQLASAILEEIAGLRQEEVVSELLSLGMASVLEGAAKAAAARQGETIPILENEPDWTPDRLREAAGKRLMLSGKRVLN